MSQNIPNLSIKPGYRPQAEDASPEVDAFGFWLLRQRTPQQRLAMGITLNRNARQFSINCFRKRFATLAPHEFAQKLAHAWLQEHYPPGYRPTGTEMTWVQDSITLAAQLHPVFESLGIPYYITGGVAAIAYGEPRTTQDLDVVIALPLQEIRTLAQVLEASGFYVPGVEDAAAGRMSTLQITHIESIARADLMLSEDSEFEHLKFERKQQYELPGGVAVYLASPEDIILSKLRWGQPVESQKQWRDVLGILKTQGETLDYSYLVEWADTLGILNTLNRALIEAGV
jgi:hypothetical protein